uniref:Myotubularin related protein 4 n=1 Tax=Sus scrofa TaxID=9823 RepID=A0A8D1AU31_PIG
MGEEGPPSLEYIQAKDLFPPKELVKEEENLQVPFTVLQGEGVEFLGRAADALIAISNYRLHIKFKDSVINVSCCLVLPHPRQNPCEIQGASVPILYLIMSPKSWGSLLFVTNPLLSAGLSFCVSHLFLSSPLSFPHSVAGPSKRQVALLEECHSPAV